MHWTYIHRVRQHTYFIYITHFIAMRKPRIFCTSFTFKLLNNVRRIEMIISALFTPVADVIHTIHNICGDSNAAVPIKSIFILNKTRGSRKPWNSILCASIETNVYLFANKFFWILQIVFIHLF